VAIAKISRPRNGLKCINYILASHDHARRKRQLVAVVASSIGRTASIAARSLKAVEKLRPNLKRHLYHVSIAVPPEERSLQNSEWARIGKSWCSGMGLENYLIVRHDDHIHIVTSRIRLDGSAASDCNDYRRSELLLRQIEQQFELKRTQSSHLLDNERRRTHRRTRTMPEAFAISQDCGVAHKDYVRDSIDQALTEGCTPADIHLRLADCGIKMTAKVSSPKGSSAQYLYRGRTYSSKSLGHGYNLESLRARSVPRAPEIGAAEEDIFNPPWASHERMEERSPKKEAPYRELIVQKLAEQRIKAERVISDFEANKLPSRKSILRGEHDSPPFRKHPPDRKS
jgi:hypothetical protein